MAFLYTDFRLLILYTHRVDTDVLYVAGEALVEPEVSPPAWGHEITEPLVSKLVRDNGRDSLLVVARRDTLLVQHSRLSEIDEEKKRVNG